MTSQELKFESWEFRSEHESNVLINQNKPYLFPTELFFLKFKKYNRHQLFVEISMRFRDFSETISGDFLDHPFAQQPALVGAVLTVALKPTALDV